MKYINSILQRIHRMLPSLISIYFVFLISGTYIFSDCRFGEENYLSYYLPYVIANFAIAFILSFFISLFKNKVQKRICCSILILFSFLAILEGLVVVKYDVFFNAFVLEALRHTNAIEANAVFTDNIFNILILLIFFVVLSLVVITIYKKLLDLSNGLLNKILNIVVYTLLFATLCVPPAYYILRNVQKFSFYFFGIANQIERIAVAFHDSYENQKCYGVYIDDNINFLNAKESISVPSDSLDCIVIIGESYARHHSNLYGYKYNTCPLEKQMVDNGNLFVFKDAISCDNATQGAFMKIFNFYGSSSKLLLPTVFKKCGFNCRNYDNEFLVSNSYDIWYDNTIISKAIYNYRNKKCFDFDEDLLKEFKVMKSRQNFYFIHLVGQHFPYNRHFPKSFNKFQKRDYSDRYGEYSQQQLADYDNCTLYNDFIINSIISKFKNRNAIAFYLSDHGEELYEYRNFNGHGNTIHDKKGLVQVEIPFTVWTSSKYKKKHPEIIRRLSKSINKRFISNMFANTVLDAVGIKCNKSNSKFSVINDNFDNSKHRITAYEYDYDKK